MLLANIKNPRFVHLLASQKHRRQPSNVPTWQESSQAIEHDTPLSGRKVASILGAAAAFVAGGSSYGMPTPAGAHRQAFPFARAAHKVTATDTAYLHLVGSPGSHLVEQGTAKGTLPGNLQVSFDAGVTVKASFTIYPRNGGSLRGRGSGKLSSAGRYSTFQGALKITGGTGKYTHAHGAGRFSAQIDRGTYALTVNTTGTFSF